MIKIVLFFALAFAVYNVTADRSFKVDYKNNCFLKDGEPFRYVSGSIHYFRVPNQLWQDRLSKMKMAGLNAIETYVEWSGHETEPGIYNFEGDYDLVKFIQTAQDLGLLVILRTGPFIDAERDMGGLPYWLMRFDPNMKIRTFNKTFLAFVDKWYNVLLPMMRPLLYANGGPIIMTQVENEYGSFGCDAQYLSYLRDIFLKHLKDEVVLFTTDGSSSSVMTCGRIDKTLSTFDFGTGTNVTNLVELLRWHRTDGPVVNSEFYPGWLDHWGQPHANVSAEAVSKTLNDVLSINGSINIYMFHGGTSFGFTAGSNLGVKYQACPTSYDYDAPLSEAGDPTDKYYSVRDTIGKFLPLPPGPVPQPAPKMKLGPIQMKKGQSIFEYASNIRGTSSPYPLSFEDLYHPFGFVLYETTVLNMTSIPVLLDVPNLADRGYVFVNQRLQGILSREQQIFKLPIKVLKGQKIQILVENQGRICFGPGVIDRKGIFKNVTLGIQQLQNWIMTPISMDSGSIKSIKNTHYTKSISLAPAWYTGKFIAPSDLYDTFVKLDGWHKGVVFINGFNLGRYWPIVGPQVTLYLPSIYLNKAPDVNIITVFEQEHSPCKNITNCVIQFVDQPIINATTPTV